MREYLTPSAQSSRRAGGRTNGWADGRTESQEHARAKCIKLHCIARSDISVLFSVVCVLGCDGGLVFSSTMTTPGMTTTTGTTTLANATDERITSERASEKGYESHPSAPKAQKFSFAGAQSNVPTTTTTTVCMAITRNGVERRGR